MSEAGASYPMLRQRRRRWRLPRLALRRYARVVAFLLLGGTLVVGIIVARRPRAPDAKALVADTLRTLAAGNYSAARRNGERAVAAAPGSVAAHVALARAWLRLGDGVAAEGEIDRAEGAGAPAARLHSLTAHARLLQGDADSAIDEIGQAPPSAYARRVRALALAARGDVGQAQQLLADLVAARPGDAAAATALGRLRLSLGEVAGAGRAAAQAVRAAPGEPAALTLQGEVVRTRYGPIAALPWFAKAVETDAYYQPALIQQAATLGDTGDYTGALAATRKALQARPRNPAALYLQAVIAARAGQRELAGRLLAATGGALDGAPAAMLLRGMLDQAAGRSEQAVARWRRLVAIQPMNIPALRLLAAALLRAGDPRGALETLRPVVQRADADAYSLTLVGRAWEAVGDRSAAAAFLDRAASGRRASDGLFATDEPIGALTAGAAAAPTDPTYALGVIRGLASSGNLAGAIAKARTLAAAAPGAPAAQLALGDTLAAKGDWAGAATAYARAADLRFDEPTALRLIDALGRAGRARDASAALALYLAQNPQSMTGERLRGHWRVAAGEGEAAIETLEGVRRQTGGRDAGLLSDLALAYAGAGEGAIARRYGAAAYRLAPMSPAASDAYGVALLADGDSAGARQLLDKAAALAPGDTVIAEHRRQLR